MCTKLDMHIFIVIESLILNGYGFFLNNIFNILFHYNKRGHCGCEPMVVGFITIYAISAYHHYHFEFESCSGMVYLIQHYMIKFVSDLRQVCGFLRVLLFSSTNKTDSHYIAEILLKVALNTITHYNKR